ncbi:FAD-binding oxidoreductase [Rhodoferax saidenbachensis]|uniref:FAD-binding oxidoreductase n=1 Tax=Rhodoferax saidenbachensis TaxID=1484693 RepID=A0A1P8K7U2_9BURK|nr:FAD-binding oxidoreductase [Rhodoferax saidenbachensis]APW42092.1 FAD-binding oxidoreductase [Rhodoferax saidenbachensis]
MTTPSLIEELVAALGADAVRSGDAIDARYQADWSGTAPVLPLALLRPASTEQVAAALRICHTHRVPVVPQGGMTGLAGGAVPQLDGVALSLERMNAIERVDAAAATITVQAGATLQAVQEAALAQGLLFGVDLGARGTCQIGGNLATNAGGNGVVQYGMAREQVLGLEVVLADGTVLPMLRPMLKNNTGYDLKHWFIGSEGTLGIITRAVLVLRPAPRARVSTLVALPDYASAIRLLRRLQARFPGALAAFELMWDDFFSTSLRWSQMASPLSQAYPFQVLAEVTGHVEADLAEALQNTLGEAMEDGSVLDAVVAQSQAQARALWRIREATAEFPTHLAPINFDISLPLDQIDAFAEECVQALTARWPTQRSFRFGHLGDGNLHLTTDARSLAGGISLAEAEHAVEEIVYGLLAQRGGSVSAEHGIGLHKKPYLHVSRTPAELAAMRAIKQALDPLNLLNPGKVFDLHPFATKATP